MRAVIQRVSKASVSNEGEVVGSIGKGLLVLLGVHTTDSPAESAWMAAKIAGLRIFPDPQGKMNLSVEEINGAVLVVSQFTLYGDCQKGRRPSFIEAGRPETAIPLYEAFINELKGRGIEVQTGRFGAHMLVELVNEGPVTLVLDTPARAEESANLPENQSE